MSGHFTTFYRYGNIVIAKMDATANDSPVAELQAQGYPTIKFVKAKDNKVWHFTIASSSLSRSRRYTARFQNSDNILATPLHQFGTLQRAALDAHCDCVCGMQAS